MSTNKRHWYFRWWAIVAWVFVGLTVIGMISNAVSTTKTPTSSRNPVQSTSSEEGTIPTTPVTPPPPTTTPASAKSTGGGGSSEPTAGQSNALESAKQYLETQAFSRKGLIKQLSSKYGEGYSKADATWAVDHLKVNWNEQAYRAAKQYLDTMPFSRAGLIQQLESSAGEGFTHAQAVYGATKAGL